MKRGLKILVHSILLSSCLQSIQPASSLNCDKTFTYYEEYGQNSFNVTCSGITKGYEHILENITINNEISLTITDSVLQNVSSNIFKNVKNIKILNIFNSTFEFDRNLPIFKKLKKLDVLYLKDTRFEVKNVTFQGLGNLKHLHLSNNDISGIETGSFEEVVNLEKLELINNHVKDVKKLQLCELKKLKYLSLKSNSISSLRSFYFSCLKNSLPLDANINSQLMFSKNMSHLLYYHIPSISYDLVELDLSLNQIVDLADSLENLEKLRLLNLGYNKLQSIMKSNLKSLNRLQKLNLTHNGIRNFDVSLFINKSQLAVVDLSYNFLPLFVAANILPLQQLDLENNIISTFSLTSLPNLKKADLRNNKITNLSSDAFQNTSNLFHLDLGGNNLNLSSGLFRNLRGLKYLYLNNNSLNVVPEKVFLGLKNLKVLDLSNNNLVILNPGTFHDLENLEMLNLSSNSIESVSYETVEPLKSLRNLDIGSNRLIYIEYDVILSKLPGLSNINIKSNQLSCEDLGKIITFLKQKHIVYTSSDHLESLNQNVAGIPCKSSIKNMLVAANSKPKGRGAWFNFGIFLIVAFGAIITGIVSFRFYVYLKRRRYRADEFELVVE